MTGGKYSKRLPSTKLRHCVGDKSFHFLPLMTKHSLEL